MALYICLATSISEEQKMQQLLNSFSYLSPQTDEFNIYTREAGAGGLSIAVEGPSKAEIDFKDKKDGSCQVSYRVAEPGEFTA